MQRLLKNLHWQGTMRSLRELMNPLPWADVLMPAAGCRATYCVPHSRVSCPLTLVCCQVEEIALLSTALVRWDGSRIMYPNVKMSTDMLINITRSGNKGDTFRVSAPACSALEYHLSLVAACICPLVCSRQGQLASRAMTCMSFDMLCIRPSH